MALAIPGLVFVDIERRLSLFLLEIEDLSYDVQIGFALVQIMHVRMVLIRSVLASWLSKVAALMCF